MKDYKVKATRLFNDGVENKERKPGDVFNCTEERYQVLKQHNAVELVEVEELILTISTNIEVPEEVVQEAPKKKITKAKKK